jgi:hypothetical protein
VPVILQLALSQVHFREPESKACDEPWKVSVRVRSEVAPPPVFSIVPLIGYVTVLLTVSAVPWPHDFDAVIAQVLKLPKRIDFMEAVAGELPEVTLANRTLLKQGATPLKIPLRSTPVSWNCSAGTTPLGNPANPGPLTLNPVPGNCGPPDWPRTIDETSFVTAQA